MSTTAETPDAKKSGGGFLGVIERVGNKVPHPVIIFLGLIVFVILLSHVLYLMGVSVTADVAEAKPVPVDVTYVGGSIAPEAIIPPDAAETQDYAIVPETFAIQSLLTVEGIRFLFTSFVSNFAGFGVVAVVFVSMIGIGVAEEAGLMGALIRKLVAVAPRWALTFIIVFIGALSNVATDAGYLILIPLGAAAFLSVKRHPLAGIAAAFAGVSAIFAVNILITPLDALLTEVTNEAIQLASPGTSITIVSNLYFAAASVLVISILTTFITERMIEPRLGAYHPATDASDGQANKTDDKKQVSPELEARGLRFTLVGLVASIVVIALATLPSGAPLRDPQTGAIIGTSPFMDSIIFIITLIFLVIGIAYGIGAKTIKSSVDVISGITKTFASLAGLVFILLIISQFIAYFNYSNMPNVIAVWLANILEQMSIGPIPLLVGFILVIALLDIIIPNSLPKWAIFAPIFIPLFMRLGVAPQTVLAAYRVGDSPLNVITPLMVYLPFIVIVAQRFQKDAGLGTIISLMLPYTGILLVAWILFFVIWFVLGIPLGPGYPVAMP